MPGTRPLRECGLPKLLALSPSLSLWIWKGRMGGKEGRWIIFCMQICSMFRYSAFGFLCFMPDCVDESYIPHSFAFIESFASYMLIHVLKSSTRNLFPLYHKVFNPLRRKWLPFTCCISNLINFLCTSIYALVSSAKWRLVVASSYKWSSTASWPFFSLNTSNWSWAINASSQSLHRQQFDNNLSCFTCK
jgi:hypothetical protein